MRRILFVFMALFAFVLPAYALQMEDVVRITPLEVMEKIDRGERPLIIDLRSRGAYDHSDIRIKGDVRIAPDELEGKLYLLPMAREIITYCTWPHEASSAGAALFLMRNGFQRVRAMKGGLDAWIKAGGPVVKK